MDDNLLQLFFERYTNKEETMYRLPMRSNIEDFWPEELQYRMQRADMLPLHSDNGHQYFYVKTDTFINSADVITQIARNNMQDGDIAQEANRILADEAYFSSTIEGACSTREKAYNLAAAKSYPANKDEQMILNNYNALSFVLSNLDCPVTEEMLVRIAGILTDKTLDGDAITGYRDEPVYVVSHTGETIYVAPDAVYVPKMMTELLAYINDSNVHPIEKAIIAHIYFVTVHPFIDGNGRTARALTYMILLKAGYDFFRYVPISGILSENRSKYYKAIKDSQTIKNGYDFTYFVNFYTEMLADSLKTLNKKIEESQKIRNSLSKLDPVADARLIDGMRWIVENNIYTVTAEQWKNRFSVSFETARKDLLHLASAGLLQKRQNGHKIFFDVI